MDIVKLPKKVRMVCYEIMDGKEGALDTLESFADQYPHQVAAVKAEVICGVQDAVLDFLNGEQVIESLPLYQLSVAVCLALQNLCVVG